MFERCALQAYEMLVKIEWMDFQIGLSDNCVLKLWQKEGEQ